MAIDLENSKKLYFSIKEVAEHFDVNESLLRFWEKEFDTINPRKTAGGSRQYSRQDIEDISLVYHLVREKGLTLEGARQMLKHKKDEATRKLDVIQRLERIRDELKSMGDEFDVE